MITGLALIVVFGRLAIVATIGWKNYRQHHLPTGLSAVTPHVVAFADEPAWSTRYTILVPFDLPIQITKFPISSSLMSTTRHCWTGVAVSHFRSSPSPDIQTKLLFPIKGKRPPLGDGRQN